MEKPYKPHNYGALFEGIQGSIDFLMAETEILDVMEKMLSSLIKSSTERISQDGKFGYAWLNRFNVMNEWGQRFFLLTYVPRLGDKMQFVQGPIGHGDFIAKKVYLQDGHGEHHVGKRVIPEVKRLFLDMGFEISELPLR